jgi:hypothetical protein
MIMPDGHWPEMAQVTPVDDQFGTLRGSHRTMTRRWFGSAHMVHLEDVDAALAQRCDDFLTSLPVMAMSPLITARPPPAGWKFTAVVRQAPPAAGDRPG